jgi:hypothetical protein
VLAVPSWERKVRVFAIWLTAALFGRDILSLASVQHPRDAFVRGGEPRCPTTRNVRDDRSRPGHVDSGQAPAHGAAMKAPISSLDTWA